MADALGARWLLISCTYDDDDATLIDFLFCGVMVSGTLPSCNGIPTTHDLAIFGVASNQHTGSNIHERYEMAVAMFRLK